MRSPIRVVLVDGHPLMRRGLRAVLAAEPDIQVVAEAADGAGTVEACRRLTPDVAAVNLTLPDMDGLTAMQRCAALGLRTRALALATVSEPETFLAVLRAGGSGYLLTHAADTQLADAIRTVEGGQVFLYASGARTLLERYFQVLHEPDGWERARAGLSQREAEVLRLTAERYSSPDIGKRLSISPRTVEVHQRRIVERLGLHDRSQLLRYAANRALLDAGIPGAQREPDRHRDPQTPDASPPSSPDGGRQTPGRC